MSYSPWYREELDTTEQLHFLSLYTFSFPGGSDGKESVCNSGDKGLISR